MGRLFLLFTLVPLGELFLLFEIADHIGGGTTFALVIGTGLLGAWLARREGSRVIRGWQQAMRNGQVPEHGVIHGVLILVGAVLLVTPGVLTDFMGLLLLLPPSRAVLAKVVLAYVERAIRDGRIQVTGVSFGQAGSPYPQAHRPGRAQVIDVEGEPTD